MFGNKEAGLSEILARLGRRSAKPTKAAERYETARSMERKLMIPTEMYFALSATNRWLR
jgi:hypothetical protein